MPIFLWLRSPGLLWLRSPERGCAIPNARRVIFWLVLALPSMVVSAASPKLNYFYPPGAQRGQTVKVTANGSFDTWPVTAWVDRPGLQLTAESDKGQFQVTVDPQAEPGLYWLRCIAADGASSLKPFMVGVLPEIVEAEPNNDPSKPQRLDGPTVINGRYGKREDVDVYAVQLTQGQTVVAALQSNNDLGSTVDGVLQICSSERFVLEHNDDARGMDPLIAFTAPADGLYLVRTFGFPATPDSSISFAGNDAYLYRLTVTTGGYVDHALPFAVTRGASAELDLQGWNIPESARRVTLGASDQDWVLGFHPDLAGSVLLPVMPHPSVAALPGSDPASPQPLTIPSVVTGVIESPRDQDVFVLAAKKGQALEIDLESDSLGFLLDGGLKVLDAAGKVVAEADDARRSRDRDPQLSFSPPADGDYRLVVEDVHGHGGARYVYRFTIQESKPNFELKLSADTFTVQRGGNLEIPVSIERDKGFELEIDIVAVNLPSGLTATTVKSAGKGDTAKKVTLVVQASAEAQSGTFQVVGRSGGEHPQENKASLGDGAPRTVTSAWITATEKK